MALSAVLFLVYARGQRGGSAKSRSDFADAPPGHPLAEFHSAAEPPPPSCTGKRRFFGILFLVLFALGEFYCYAVILCFAQCYSLRELIANKIKLKQQVSISLSRSENITLPSGRITLFFSGNPLLSFVPTNLKPPANPTDQ